MNFKPLSRHRPIHMCITLAASPLDTTVKQLLPTPNGYKSGMFTVWLSTGKDPWSIVHHNHLEALFKHGLWRENAEARQE